MREICLDTETTGLDPKEGHKLIEIAAIEMVNKVRTGRFYHKYINPRRDVPMQAYEVHGISTEFLADKPIFDHVAHEFLEFIKGGTLVIHNAAFDLKFLNHELSMSGLPIIDKKDVIDSLHLARKKFPGSPASLDALCKRFSIDLSRRTKHGALLDTELLCDVYIELKGGAQEGLEFAKKNLDDEIQDEFFDIANYKKNKIRESRNFKLDNKTLQSHEEFIKKNIKDSLWYS